MNKKGYTLTYAIIVIGLLLILTGSVTLISYYNLKTSRIGGNVNTSFYANDAALEEAISELKVYTYNAEVAAWNRIRNPNMLNEPTWSNFLNAIYEDINNNVMTIDQGNDVVARALRGEFESTFYNNLYSGTHASHAFFDSGQFGVNKYLDFSAYSGLQVTAVSSLDSGIVAVLEDEDIVTDSDKSLDSIVTADASPVITVSGISLNGDGSFDFKISSDGTYHKFNKQLEVDLTIQAPKYEFSVAMLQKNIALSRNKATNQVLLANGHIVFAEGTSNVEGDIYAYGQSIDVKYNGPRDNYGGIILGYEQDAYAAYESSTLENQMGYNTDRSGAASITGNVATRNAIKMETSNSALTVSENVYANAFYVRPSSSNTSTTVLDNMFLYADLYIGGDNASVVVGNTTPSFAGATNRNTYRPTDGEIWGLHDANFAAGDEYTRTGSIIISTNASNPSITANGIYLFGVSRFSAFDTDIFATQSKKQAYKSGESMTTYKNSQYYQTLLSDNIYQSGVFATLKQFTDAANSGIKYDLVTFANFYNNLNQVQYRSNHYYTMGFAASQDTENIYKKISDSDKAIIKLRDTLKNSDGEYYAVATTGLIAFDDISNAAKGLVVNSTKTPSLGLDTLSKSILRTDELVDEKISLLGFTKKTGSDTYSEVSLFNSWFNTGANSVPLTSSASSDVALYNKDASKDIFINATGPSGSINILGLGTSDEKFTGTLVSAGDIYINADAGERVTFTGNIISQKNIYFIGAGEKKIIHNELDIYKAINSQDALKAFYHTNNGKQLQVHLNSKDAGFDVTLANNDAESEKIRINYVSDAITDGTNVTESNSVIINNWTETN